MSLSSGRNGAEHPARHQQGDGAVPAAVGVAVCSQEPVRPLAGPEPLRGCARTGPSAATRCPYQILTRRGLCSARQSTRQTRQSNAPLPLLLPRGSGGSHSHSWALSGAGSSLLDPELPPSSAAAYRRTVTASFCISSFSTASHSPRSPLLKRARPPYQPYLWLSQPQRGRRVGS